MIWTDEYYREIDEIEFNAAIGDENDHGQISEREIARIKRKIASIKDIPISEVQIDALPIGYTIDCFDFHRVEVFSTKDQWFFVYKHPSYYKCSQRDGLIVCLENIITGSGR